MRLVDGRVLPPMSQKEARLVLAAFAKAKGVEPRIVQDERERARMQAQDRSGHQWKVGDEYISIEDVRRA